MKFLKAIPYLMIFLLLSVVAVGAFPKSINTAIKSGNATEIAKYFDSNVELSINGNKSVYSKAQATQVLSNFFKQNKPTAFAEKHSGGRENSKYLIGTLTTEGATQYRITILYKGEQPSISQFTIEKDMGF